MRLIDCNPLFNECAKLAAIEWNRKVSPTSWAEAEEEFMRRLEEAPVIDAVQVVRCKECKCGKIPDMTSQKDRYRLCGLYSSLPIMRLDDFCSYGERRGDG